MRTPVGLYRAFKTKAAQEKTHKFIISSFMSVWDNTGAGLENHGVMTLSLHHPWSVPDGIYNP